MPNVLQQAGALSEPTNFAPLHTNRIFTGLWTNRSFLRDAATSDYMERYGMSRQDSIMDGLNTEISPRLTLMRRPGSTVYNPSIIDPIKRFYSFNTFSLTDELIRVMADTATDVLDVTAPDSTSIWTKSAGAGSTYFLSIGNTLYFTNGVENKQWVYGLNTVWDWGIEAPPNAPTVTQVPRPNTYPSWQAGTGYEVTSPAISGILILDDLTNAPGNVKFIPTQTGGQVAVMCGQNYQNGSSIALPPGFDTSHLMVWVTPGAGFNPTSLPAGVYKSYGTGGVLNSSFQNRSGAHDFDATNNWIAVAWNAASGVVPFTSGNYSGISFHTVAGDQMALQIGGGYTASNIPVPAGFTAAQSLSIAGMEGCDNVNHSMYGVATCTVNKGTTQILDEYYDGSGNVWFGNAAVFSVFWILGQNIITANVTNGTALLIPTTGGNSVTFIFAVVPQGQTYGLPPGFSADQIIATAAMAGAANTATGSRGHGWNCVLNGQTFDGYYMDADSNQWAATGNVFAVGAVSAATGGNVQFANGSGTTGNAEPSPWNATVGGPTADGTITWTCLGPAAWQANHAYALGSVVMGVVLGSPGTPNQLYVASTPGTSGASEPRWQVGVGLQRLDGTVVWTCLGRALSWNDLGAGTPITAASTILDSNGYLETVYSPGKSGTAEPTWATELGALTADNTVIWQNIGPFAVQGTAPVQYGYAYMNSATDDISNMSPASTPITIMKGNQAIVQGDGSSDPQVDTVIIYRTAQGGSTFLYADQIPNPGGGQTWTWIDNVSDDELNTEWQAQVAGEGTPLPDGATCLGYHLGRIFAAVGNVVWISSGPDAVAADSSGNAGFDTTFTAQSKIIRFWACPLGMIVFTVRDAYIILGSATEQDPLYMVVFIEDLPLRSYDCFTVNKTTPYLLLGDGTLVALDPSAGITEVGFPIANLLLYEFDPGISYVTFHKQSGLDTALYVANGFDHWYRMAAVSAPESGSAWSPRAVIPGGIGMGCVQSVEVEPGKYRLLIHTTTPGPILQRDIAIRSDNGTPYPAFTRIGAIVLALPGQLAALHFITLESAKIGTRASLALLLGEARGTFEPLQRTRQDPTNLPPSDTLYSDRYHFAQNQQTAWCRHFQMRIEWPEEDADNELFTFTIFGQTWQEMRAQ